MPTDTAAHSKLQKERVRGGASAEHVHASILAVAAMYKASGNAAFKDKKYAEGISYYQVSVCLFLSVCVFLNMCPPPHTHGHIHMYMRAHTTHARAHTHTPGGTIVDGHRRIQSGKRRRNSGGGGRRTQDHVSLQYCCREP